jgi:autotransporter-associated beta strand protein
MSGGTAVTGEVHVGVGGTGTSTLNVSGSASITESYLLLANYDGATTGNVNVGSVSQPGGTITVNADMDVGGQGNGTLNFVTNGGGKVTVTGTLYLSRFSATADGTVNLNAGGTLIAGYINNGWGFQNNLPTPTSNPNAFNFNGGTLQAYTGSAYFIQPYVNAVVQSGGAIINDGGFSITVLAPLVSGGGAGGLTKQGNGTLILNGVNTYTGTTLVSAGTLAVGASGSIAGPVTVASGATLAADTGSIQTTYINNTLTLAAGSTTSMQITPSSNDQIAGLTGVNYGGALVVTNSSGSLLVPNSVFQLFHSSAPGGGNFSSITILPYGAGTFNPATGLLTITSVGFPAINPPGISGGKLILTGTGGTAGSGYTVLSSTNVATPLADWVTNTTGTFNGTGGFSNAIPVTNKPALFFEIRVP